MDTFFEQIIRVRRTKAQLAGVVGIWFLAFILAIADFIFLISSPLATFGLLILFGIGWGAWKLTSLSSIEYEYIFTNGDLDIDKIIAKSSRKRVASISCTRAERYGKFNPSARPSGSVQKVLTFCETNEPNAYFIVAPMKNEGNVMIVFAPDDRVRGAIEKAVPRIAL